MTRLSEISSVHWQPALRQPGVVEGIADIDQAIRVILGTPKGSDPHRPNFGSNIHRYIDHPVRVAIPHVVREAVEAIRAWETRCTLVRVTPVVDDAQLVLRVVWKLADSVLRETEVRL